MNRTNKRFKERLNKLSEIDAQRLIRRKINNTLNILSFRYDRAVTNDQRVIIANHMEDLCNAEIDYWNNILSTTNQATELNYSILLDEASLHISNFQEIILKINEVRKELINPVQQ